MSWFPMLPWMHNLEHNKAQFVHVTVNDILDHIPALRNVLRLYDQSLNCTNNDEALSNDRNEASFI